MIRPFRNAEFSSARLRMRPQSPDDAVALHAAYSDVELMTYWSSGPHHSVDETIAYLSGDAKSADWRGWTVLRTEDGAIVATLAQHDHRERVAEIGYMVLRRYWGQGYAQEAVARLIELLFADEGYRRVMADTDPDNAASNALLQRLGFVLEGRLRGEWETHIGVRDSLIWGLLADESRDRA